MSDEKLIDALRRMSPRLDMLDCENVLTAADRISAQAAEIERLRGDLKRAVEERDEALNQLDSAMHSVDVLLNRVAELTVSATVKDSLTTEDEKQSHEWKCPIDYPGCRKNCGSQYGCKN